LLSCPEDPGGVLRCVCACVVDIMHVHESMQLIRHGAELSDIGSTGHKEV
jgi:hypothetical protein